jgi:enoyl-CoA hydratase/carnithine racemase
VEEYKTIHFKEDDSIGLITLNRPEKLNAFNSRMMAEMLDVFDHIDAEDSIKAVIILLEQRLLIQSLIHLRSMKQTLEEILEAY